MKTAIRHNGGVSNVWSTDGGATFNWSNAAGEGSGEPTFQAAETAAEAALAKVTHHVDINSGEDVITINGLATKPRRVLGIGRNLWVWSQGAVYHAADWSGDLVDITPLVKMSEVYYLKTIAENISRDLAAHVAVCEFSAEDATPTLHVDLWKSYDLSDLPQAVAELAVAAEGNWDGGRSYSLQLA